MSIKEPLISTLLKVLSVFWGIEMIAEGFWFASGSFAFFNFWLLLGAAEAYVLLERKHGLQFLTQK